MGRATDGDGLVVLLTGFGPFPGVEHNVSWDMAQALEQQVGAIEGVTRAVARPLATIWGEAEESFSRALAELSPDIVISLGVSRAGRGIEIEAVGRRRSQALADAAGRLPPKVATEQWRPESRRPRFDVAEIARRMAAGDVGAVGACRISRDAGGYLCNAVYYHGLGVTDLDRRGGTVIFVHIPADLESDGPATFEEVRRGLVRLTALVVDMAREGMRGKRAVTGRRAPG